MRKLSIVLLGLILLASPPAFAQIAASSTAHDVLPAGFGDLGGTTWRVHTEHSCHFGRPTYVSPDGVPNYWYSNRIIEWDFDFRLSFGLSSATAVGHVHQLRAHRWSPSIRNTTVCDVAYRGHDGGALKVLLDCDVSASLGSENQQNAFRDFDVRLDLIFDRDKTMAHVFDPLDEQAFILRNQAATPTPINCFGGGTAVRILSRPTVGDN